MERRAVETDAEIRRIVSAAIRNCSKKREQIADELSASLGLPVSLHMLNAFTSERKRAHRFPALFIESFCEITGDDSLRRFAVGEKLRDLIELGEAVLRILGERECSAIRGKALRRQAR